MVLLVAIIGAAICAVAGILLIKPMVYLSFAERALDSKYLRATAIVIRIVLGAIFMLAAPATRYPGGIFWIGAIFVGAALAMLFYPSQKLRELVGFWNEHPGAVRWVAALVFIFGSYLVYAAV
jgi:hypothetical protein